MPGTPAPPQPPEPRHLGGAFYLVPAPPDGPDEPRVEAGFRHPDWRPSRPASPGRAAFPGTALELGNAWYEIRRITSTPGPPPRTVYHLGPWDDSNPLRRVDQLTAEVCEQATAEHWRQRRDQHVGETLGLIPFLIGLLPAADQLRIERRYGLAAVRSTRLSAGLLLFSSIVLLMIFFALSQGHHFGEWHATLRSLANFRPLFAYFTIESLVRLGASAGTGPIGSLPVALPLLAVRWLRQAVSPEARQQAAVERTRRSVERVFDTARDQVRRLPSGGFEILSLLPKDHWTANVTGIRYRGETYVLTEREVRQTEDGARHRFVLELPEHEILYRYFYDYRPEEVRDIYRAERRRDTAMWAETFSFLWGFVDGETQERLGRIYNYDPWKHTRRAAIGGLAIGLLAAADGLWNAAFGVGSPAIETFKIFGGAYFAWEAWLRRRSLQAGVLRGSLLGLALAPLARPLLRWEAVPNSASSASP